MIREFFLEREGAQPRAYVVELHLDSEGGGSLETRPLRHRVHHSPTGMEWGYGGSGPADLARSMVAELMGTDDPHPAAYMEVKDHIVGRLPEGGGVVSAADVIRVAFPWLVAAAPALLEAADAMYDVLHETRDGYAGEWCHADTGEFDDVLRPLLEARKITQRYREEVTAS